MFPGNSSQREKMFCNQYEESDTFKGYFDKASDILGYDLYNLSQNITREMLLDIEINTPIIASGGYASFKFFLEKYKIIPKCLIGHSLGEITAIAAADIINLKDMLKLVSVRAKLAKKIKEKNNMYMCVISRLDSDFIEKCVLAMKDNLADVCISCYNTPSQICISGHQKDIQLVMNVFVSEGGKVRIVEGNAPFHSVFMEEVKDEFKALLDQIEFKDPKIPVYSNWFGEVYTPQNAKEILVNHLLQPINWYELIEKCAKQNVNCFVEFGSNGILTRMMHNINVYIKTINFDDKNEREKL